MPVLAVGWSSAMASRLRLSKRLAVPAFLVLDEGDACALKGLGEDDQRLGAQADGGQHFENLLQVVPVNLLRAPAEGLEAPACKH